MKVIYHANCDDGFGAAWVAWQHFVGIGIEAEYVPARYGEQPPDTREDETVFILDFSYPRQILLDMATRARLVVLDHHKTAQADLFDLPFTTFNMEKSGAVLAWEHFFPDDQTPLRLLRYIQDRDLWRKELPDSEAVTEYIRSWPRDFETWSTIARKMENGWADVVAEGNAILRRTQQQVEVAVARCWWQDVGGYCVPVANETHHFSEVAGELAKCKDVAFGAVYFDREDGKRQWSLRSHGDFDVSEVAKALGGGGHKNAAGFVSGVKE